MISTPQNSCYNWLWASIYCRLGIVGNCGKVRYRGHRDMHIGVEPGGSQIAEG